MMNKTLIPDGSALKDQGRAGMSDWITTICVAIVGVSLVVLGLSLYKGFASSQRTLVAGVMGLIGVILPPVYLARGYLNSHTTERRHFWMIASMSLVTILTIVLAAELVLRINTKAHSQGVEVFGRVLLPRDWQRVSAWNYSLLQKFSMGESILVADDVLGWTVGANRVSEDGLYKSGKEGIRSPAVGVSYKKPQRSHRLAIVGDSFTFGIGVPFESSWGAQLEYRMADTVEVLNFGVNGYGIDQAYLRYTRDAKPLHPDIVMLGFISWDFPRVLHVYPFVGSDWQIPFAKPRFDIQGEVIEPVNVPLMAPSNLFDLPTVTSLPFLEYEPGFVADEWDWKWYHRSTLVRYLVSRFPRWPNPSPVSSEAAMGVINVVILDRFVREVEAAGAIPLLVYLPSLSDFDEDESQKRNWDLVRSRMRDKGLSFSDLTACMKQDDYRALFLRGDPHYSAEGNARAAECLKAIIEKRIAHSVSSYVG
jgi:hypothetical protein